MEAFLAGLDAASTPVSRESRVLAALGPKMLELWHASAPAARTRTTSPPNTPRRHARSSDRTANSSPSRPWRSPPTEERPTASVEPSSTTTYPCPTTANNLRRLGFTDDDLAHGGSSRLVDALIAWGDEDAIASRVKEHLDAGADSVCIQVVSDGDMAGMTAVPRPIWRALAPALTVL